MCALDSGLGIMKYFIVLALVFAVMSALRRAQARRNEERSPVSPSVPENMVTCAYCGVNQPVSESISMNGQYFCCRAHLRAAGLAGG